MKTYKKLVKAGAFDDLADLELICRYYESERRKGDDGYHRRNLPTFLNNYWGELDKARAWEEGRLEKQKRARRTERVEGTNGTQPLPDNEFQKVGSLVAQQLKEWRQQLKTA